jgi:hypothetical protein
MKLKSHKGPNGALFSWDDDNPEGIVEVACIINAPRYCHIHLTDLHSLIKEMQPKEEGK